MENLQIKDQFDSVTFRNKKDICIIEVQNEQEISMFRLRKSDAIEIIKHLQEWVGIKDMQNLVCDHRYHSKNGRYMLYEGWCEKCGSYC